MTTFNGMTSTLFHENRSFALEAEKKTHRHAVWRSHIPIFPQGNLTQNHFHMEVSKTLHGHSHTENVTK